MINVNLWILLLEFGDPYKFVIVTWMDNRDHTWRRVAHTGWLHNKH